VVHKLLSGIDQTERSDLVVKAAEEVFGDSADEEGEATKAKAPVPEALKRAQSHGRLSLLKGSCLYQMNIPDNLEKKTYGCLFKYLSVQGIVPLGLLRGTLANINIGPKANKLPYVYTNPDKDAEVFSCDRVFVLSQKPERVAGKMEMKVSICLSDLLFVVLMIIYIKIGLVIGSTNAKQAKRWNIKHTHFSFEIHGNGRKITSQIRRKSA